MPLILPSQPKKYDVGESSPYVAILGFSFDTQTKECQIHVGTWVSKEALVAGREPVDKKLLKFNGASKAQKDEEPSFKTLFSSKECQAVIKAMERMALRRMSDFSNAEIE